VDRRGYVLTSDHLVADGKDLQVALADGRTLPVKQVWRDQLAGVAVLKVDGTGLPALPLGESGELRVGDAAIVVGGPAAARGSPAGHATVRSTGAATGGNLAIDAPIASEHAGVPLVDARGRVVGIASSEAHVMGDASRGGFAVPIDRAKPVLRRARASWAQ
jgi:S1-C subfamily serine protease